MSRVSKEQIEKDEKKVLRELERNANESIDKIAKKCGFSRQKVWRIIKNLEKNHTIWGYSAITDDEKRDLKNFIVLIKKTTQPIDEVLAEKIIVRKIEDLVPTNKVRIEDSLYTHGAYDWIITFSAENIKQAKKFCETLNNFYQGHIGDLQLLETMFPIRRKGILNPEASKLKEFV